jgi:hypothetical protein
MRAPPPVMRTLPSLAAVLTLAAFAAGCGGGDDTADSGPAPTTATTATATTPAQSTPTTTTGAPAPPEQTERDRISNCLTKAGYRLQGGAPQVTDSEAPDYQIIFSGRQGGGYIGFYKNASRAARVGKRLRTNAQRTSGAAVERHGAINIIWVDLSQPAAREAVRGCLVT